MKNSIETLQQAIQYAMKIRPPVQGFPFLAETLRLAGVNKNIWDLPSCQSIYIMQNGNVVFQGANLVNGFAEIPRFDKEALIRALRADQEGRSVFPEFLSHAWQAGVVRYEVDFEKRHVTYFGASNEFYREEYKAVDITLPF